MLSALATVADAEAFGFVGVTSAALVQASTRVRARARQQISAGSSTVAGQGPSFRLPQRPVVDVTSVTDSDGAAVEFEVRPGGFLVTACDDVLTVEYDHGLTDIPDEVVEIVCTIAARLSGALSSAGQTLGFDAWRGQFGLTAEEKSVIDGLFPRPPRLIVQRP